MLSFTPSKAGRVFVAALAALLLPACVPSPEPQPTEDPAMAMAEEEITFTSGADTLHGTFTMPEGASGPVPAALIISGSGPTDRDGNSEFRPNAGTNANFARALADAGVATLRYDKLGSGRTGTASRPEDGEVGYDVFEEHMAAAYAALAARPEVDPERLLVVGHSEGSLFALRSPQVVEDAPPRALILAAPVGDRYLDVLDRQLTEMVRIEEGRGSIQVQQATEILSDLRYGIARIRAGEPTGDLHPALLGLLAEENQSFLRQADSLDPRELAADLPAGMPSLVLWGTDDAQVTGEEVDRLMSGLEEGTRVDLPGVDHVFRRSADSPGASVLDEDRPFSPDVGPAMEEFLAGLW